MLWYLATPYAKYPAGIDAAFEDAAVQAATLVSKGIMVFCPITHSHPVSRHIIGGDHAFYMAWDQPFMDRCDGLIVCKLAGWMESKGVTQEIDTFHAAGKPVVFMTPFIVPVL